MAILVIDKYSCSRINVMIEYHCKTNLSLTVLSSNTYISFSLWGCLFALVCLSGRASSVLFQADATVLLAASSPLA